MKRRQIRYCLYHQLTFIFCSLFGGHSGGGVQHSCSMTHVRTLDRPKRAVIQVESVFRLCVGLAGCQPSILGGTGHRNLEAAERIALPIICFASRRLAVLATPPLRSSLSSCIGTIRRTTTLHDMPTRSPQMAEIG